MTQNLSYSSGIKRLTELVSKSRKTNLIALYTAREIEMETDFIQGLLNGIFKGAERVFVGFHLRSGMMKRDIPFIKERRVTGYMPIISGYEADDLPIAQVNRFCRRSFLKHPNASIYVPEQHVITSQDYSGIDYLVNTSTIN